MNIKEAGWKLFSLRSEEMSFAIPLFFIYFLSGIFFATGQVYTESLFLQTYGAKGLAKFFAINGIVLFLSGFIYTYFLELFSLTRAFILLILLFCCIPASTLLPSGYALHDPLYLFIGNYIATFYLDAHFINFSFQYLTLQSSKRIFPFLMAGSKLGGIFITITISIASSLFIHYASYIWLFTGLLILIPFFTTAKTRHVLHTKSEHKFIDKLSTLFSSRMFVVSAAAVFVMAIVNQHAEYFFARIATHIYPSQHTLAVFLSKYTFITDCITMAMQLFVTSRVIKKLSIPITNLLYPSSYLLFIFYALLSPTLLAAIALRFFRKNMSFFIRQPVSNIMLSIYPADRVSQARSIITSIVSPCGMIVGGLMLSLYVSLPLQIIVALSIGVGLLFVAVTLKQNALYKEAIYCKLQQHLPQTLQITHSQITELLKNPYIENKSEYIDALLQKGMSADVFPLILEHYDSLSETTKINMLSILYEAPHDIATEMSKKALNDTNLLVRVYAYRYVSHFTQINPGDILQNHIPILPIESFIHRLLTDTDKYNSDHISQMLHQCEQRILNNIPNADIEFLMLCSVIDPGLFIHKLYRLAITTGNIIFFKFIILYAHMLPQSQVIRILYKFRYAPLAELQHFLSRTSINSEIKFMLCDYRFDMTADVFAALYAGDYNFTIPENRLIQKRSYHKKINYLNIFLAANVLPQENLPLFINSSIARIHQLLQCKATISTLPISNCIKDFLLVIFTDALHYEKNLLIKALALSTGVHVDIAYESNMLLKDVELENYIIEFLTLTQKGKKVALLETYSAREIAPVQLPLFIKNCKYLRSSMPAIAKQLDFSLKHIETNNLLLEDPVAQTIHILTFLKQNALFAETPVDQLIHLVQIARIHKFPENTEFIKEDETGDELFIIMDGQVSVTRRGKEIARLGAGSCIGELSIIDKEPRSATVKTTRPSLVLSISRNDFLLTLKANPTIAINVMKVIAQRLRSILSQYNA
ncbi:MAG: cyclic nucleotide-binding domain-containing protein [Spirochaetes bacterium]|nr:cyclic nucleotide-binding domain-containing protein [Spirochaetota bacterium]